MRVSPILATSVIPGLLVFLQRIEAGGLASARHRISSWSRPSSSWPVGTPTNLVSGASKFMRNAQLITRALIPRDASNMYINLLYICISRSVSLESLFRYRMLQISRNNLLSFNFRKCTKIHRLRQSYYLLEKVFVKKIIYIIFYYIYIIMLYIFSSSVEFFLNFTNSVRTSVYKCDLTFNIKLAV